MEKIEITVERREISADALTPIAIYCRIRDEYPNALLLESSDYHNKEYNYSYICCHPIAQFSVENNYIFIKHPNQNKPPIPIKKREQVISSFEDFRHSFLCKEFSHLKQNYPFVTGGFFGFCSYDAVQYFEEINITQKQRMVPDILYQLFSIVIVFDHFQEKLYIFEYKTKQQSSILDIVCARVRYKQFTYYPFFSNLEEKSNYTDEEFLKIVEQGIEHCQRGNVFQIVLSRKFFQEFRGDEWNVYRALRSINPSPYLFYFDYGSFKIFGSSPESQIVIKNQEAIIYPIAGTFKRTGNDSKDAKLAKELFNDEKETAEHSMLVDLARNDLSKQSQDVTVEVLKEIQYYSHVIHMVSKVVAKIKNNSPMQLFADTFPAGTLSGAPKYRAMQLIDELEESNRGFYGGAIGYIGFGGEVNHAIMIRTILSKEGKLHYQAGGGVVALSKKESELQEVNNKKAALKAAIQKANNENFNF